MGERARLIGPFGGQFSLNDFLGQLNNSATPATIIRTMLPVQEMREFQRRYLYSAGKQTLQIGEDLVLRWTVPLQEYWRPRTLMFTNKDNALKTIRVEFTVDKSGDNIYRAVQTRVDAGESQVVYGQTIDGSIGTGISRFASLLPNIMEPGDVMTMIQSQNVAILSEQSWTMIYELVPQPATPLVRGIAAVPTVT